MKYETYFVDNLKINMRFLPNKNKLIAYKAKTFYYLIFRQITLNKYSN